VPGIATIHYSLGHVNSHAGDIGALIHVRNAADRPAVNSHAQLQMGIGFERISDFQCTLDWRFRSIEEDQSHSIANRKPDKLASSLGGAKVFGASHDLSELPLDFSLLVREQFRVTDHVHK